LSAGPTIQFLQVETICPQSAYPELAPSPRNESAAAVRTTVPTSMEATMSTEYTEFGRICLRMIFI